MRLERVVVRNRLLLSLGLLGMFAMAAGCDGSGGGGESNVAPATPPPGQSAKDQMELRSKSPGAPGVPPKRR